MIKKSRIFLKGFNFFGQFGFDTDFDYNKDYKEFNELYNVNIKKIDGNISQSFYLMENGDMYFCGWNFDNLQPLKFIRYHDNYSFIMNYLRNIKWIGFNEINPLKIINQDENIKNFSLVGSGLYFYNDDFLYSVGDNTRKQLSHDTEFVLCPEKIINEKFNVNDIRSIVGGDQHSFILLNNGSIYASGACNFNQYLSDKMLNHTKESNNRENEFILDKVNLPGEDVIKISCGFTHSIFLTYSNKIFSCGNNMWGQCGMLNNQEHMVFLLVW